MLASATASIKEIRKSYDLTQEQLAHILGTSWVTISRWERGVSEPSAEAEERLGRMEVLLKHIDTLIAREDLPKFLFTPNPAMANFPPTDLLQSGYAFRKLIELVEKTKHGDFS
jgi:transcriptional regulator with XRE-family HTH domain